MRIERVFRHPRERVFEAFTDPELVAQWWGPRGTTTTIELWEARTGGDWRARITGSDGAGQTFRGTFREITAPERIVRTTTPERGGMLASGIERGTNDSFDRLDEVLAAGATTAA